MEEQVLKDLIATSEALDYNWDEILPKFPELEGIELQVLKDYVETAKAYDYDYDVINPKFPELNIKKKDDSQSTSPEVVTESTTETVQESPTSSDASVATITETASDPEEVFQFEAGRRNRRQEEQLQQPNLEELTTEEIEALPGTQEEDTAIERAFGKNWLTDFFGDIYRAGDAGITKGMAVDDALKLFGKGASASPEEISAFIAAVNEMNQTGVSDEMREFNEIYKEEGEGVWGFLKGVALNPSLAPELLVNSLASMVNPASLSAAGAVTTGFTATGAGVGSAAGGVGAIPGAVGGFISSLPWAYGAAGATLETGLSFAEFLQEEVSKKGKKFDEEGVLAVLNDPDAMFRIRSKSAARGGVIGVVDRYTLGLTSQLTKKVAAQTGKKMLGVGTGLATEAVGGSTGEALARVAAGQDMDVAEIGFEGFAGLGSAPITVAKGLYRAPVYKITGETRTGEEVAKFIREAPDNDFFTMDIEIINDPELKAVYDERKNKLRNKKAVIEDVRSDIEGLSTEDQNKVIDLEIELREKEGKNSRFSKKRVKEIEAELDAIYDKNKIKRKKGVQQEEITVTDEEARASLEQDNKLNAQMEERGMPNSGQKIIDNTAIQERKQKLLKEKQDAAKKSDTEITVTDEEVINSFKEDGVDTSNPDEVRKITAEKIADRKKELLTKKKKDAIQESSTTEVDAQVQTEDGSEVGGRNTTRETTTTPESQTETNTETQTQEKVAPEVQEEVKDLQTLLEEQSKIQKTPDTTVEETTDISIQEDTNTGEINLTRKNKGKLSRIKQKGKRQGNTNLFVTEDVNQTETTPQQSKILSFAEKAIKTISKVLPDVKIVVHKNQDTFDNSVDVEEQGSRGVYVPATKTIHINAGKANNRTIAHEVFHALVIDKIGSDVEIGRVTKKMVESVAKRVKDPKVKKELNDFIADYETNIQNEEYLAEITGMLASNFTTLDAPTKSVVRRWAERIAKSIGLDKIINIETEFTADDQAVVDLLTTIAKKTKEGTEITDKDLSYLDDQIHGDLVDNASGVIPDNVDTKGGKEINLNRQQKGLLNRRNININDIKRGSINDLAGTNAFVFAADKAVYGQIESPSGLKFDFSGGFLYPYGSGKAWAFTDKQNAQRVLNKAKESDGVGLVMVQGSRGITGSFNFWQYLNAEIAHAINKGVNPQELLTYVNKKLATPLVAKALKNKGAIPQIQNLEQLNTLMPFEGKNKFSYGERAKFADVFFSGESATKFGIPPLEPNKTFDTGVLNYVNDPALMDTEYGDIVSAIQFDKNSTISEVREGDPNFHPSYPFVLEGNPLMVFDKAIDVRKVYPDAKAKMETMNQTPLSKRTKPRAAKSAMGGQYVTKVKKGIKPRGVEVKVENQSRQQKSVEAEVMKLANMSGMNESSFLPANLWNPGNLRKRLAQYGYTLRPHYRSYGDGGLTGYSIRRPNGSMVKRPARNNNVNRLQKSLPKRDLNPVEIVNFARENNFGRAAIREVLIKNKGVSAKEADALLDIKVDLFNSLPESFGNIGLTDGIRLFKKVLNFADKLSKRKGKKKLTPAQIQEQTLQFLEEQKEYKDQSDKGKKTPSTQQDQMYIDTSKALGIKPTVDIAEKVQRLRKEIKQRKRGARDLQSVKRKLRNYIRQTIPKESYDKNKVMKIVRMVTDVTEKNLDNKIQEILEETTKIQVSLLDSSIKSILDGVYETIQAGKKVGKKIDTETRQRLEKIRDSYIASDKDTGVDIVNKNLLLNEELNKLQEKVDSTVEDQNKMLDLMAAMAYNNAMLMDNTDVNKVESLGRAEDILAGILGEGKQKFKDQLAEDHNRYKKQFEQVYKAITGKKVDLDNPEAKAQMKKDKSKLSRRAAREEGKKGINKVLNVIGRKMKSFFKSSESLAGLMEIIASAPGVMFGGKAREIVYETINKSSIIFKKRMMDNQKIIKKKLREIYGKGWEKKNRKNTQDNILDIYVNPEEVAEAQKAKDENNNSKTRKALREAKKNNQITLSNNKIAYLWQQYQDPANIPSFANEENKFFGPDHQRIMKELLESTGAEVIVNDQGNLEVTKSNEVLDFAAWQVNEFYPSLYGHYNDSYQKIYRTNLPWNRYYGGRIFREGLTPDPLNLLGNKTQLNNAVGAASTKVRISNDNPIMPVDMMDSMNTYINDMEWFAAFGPTIRDINKLFNNPTMRETITATHGAATMRLIDHALKNIASRGIQEGSKNQFINSINNFFIATRLGLNPSIFVKQMSSMITYANDINPVNYVKYAVKNLPQFISVFKEIWNNSTYVEERWNTDLRRALESYNADTIQKFVPATVNNFWVGLMMGFVKMGDMGAIMLGGMPNYSYYKAEFKKKNPNATEQQAIDYAIEKFEDNTKNTQQSMDLQDRDYYQSTDAITRSLNMFLTTPKQYLRKEFSGWRNMKRGIKNRDMKQFFSGVGTFGMYHVMMPISFQYIVLGLPGLLRSADDEDFEDLTRAAVLGNFNALFIVGDILSGIADGLQEKQYVGKVAGMAPYQALNELTQAYTNMQKSKTDETRQKHAERLYTRLLELGTGGKIPFYNLNRFYKNIEKAQEAENSGEIMLRLMNYSDYMINKGGEDVQIDMKWLKENQPDVYRTLKDIEAETMSGDELDSYLDEYLEIPE